MKKITKNSAPQVLIDYSINNPNATWDKFKKKRNRILPVQTQLKKDQGWLCVYCEIDLKAKNSEDEVDDFRVEHFHPKSDTSVTSDNWHLKWDNLFACCHGGSEKKVADASKRFEKEPIERTCDIPKEDAVLDDIILNPLELNAFPSVFKTDRASGKLQGNPDYKKEHIANAKNTINSLNLNSIRLSRFRAEILNKINHELQNRLKSGAKIDEVLNELAQSQLLKRNEQWPAFFSSIRSYLGIEAEKVLRENKFDG